MNKRGSGRLGVTPRRRIRCCVPTLRPPTAVSAIAPPPPSVAPIQQLTTLGIAGYIHTCSSCGAGCHWLAPATGPPSGCWLSSGTGLVALAPWRWSTAQCTVSWGTPSLGSPATNGAGTGAGHGTWFRHTGLGAGCLLASWRLAGFGGWSADPSAHS